MTKFIPAILEQNENDFLEKVEIMQRTGLKIGHLDVMDGVAVPNKCWGDIDIVKKMNMKFEVHLMVKDSLEVAKEWLKYKNIIRVIARYEEIYNKEWYYNLAKKNPKLGIAIDPNKEATEIFYNIHKHNFLLIMGVNSGFSGQEFNPKILARINRAKSNRPMLQIGVDGGMNESTIPRVKELGVDVINAASYFWEGDYERKIDLIERE